MKTHVPWSEIYTACSNIAQQALTYSPDCIVALSRGGYVPARFIAETLNIKHVYSLGITSYNNNNEQENIKIYQDPIEDIVANQHKLALIVDEIADSGNTFNYLSKLWCKQNKVSCIFSSLYVKEHSIMTPSIFFKKISNSKWLIFPWEANYWYDTPTKSN